MLDLEARMSSPIFPKSVPKSRDWLEIGVGGHLRFEGGPLKSDEELSKSPGDPGRESKDKDPDEKRRV